MARISYANLNTDSTRPLVDQIIAERGSVLHLYQMLLHSPSIAQGWLNHLTGIRLKSNLSGDIRELVIMRIAYLNGAPYEAEQHAPIALKEGVSQAQLNALKGDWQASQTFNAKLSAVLAYTDSMTKSIQVPDDIFNQVKYYFNEPEIVELTATIATYNMVSRFLEALQIHSHDKR